MSEKASTESAGPIARILGILAVSLLLAAAAIGLNLPWPLEPSARAALPYLALPIVHWHAFRMPHLLPAPVVLAAGLLADLLADTPFGFWPLIYLAVFGSGRGMRRLGGEGRGLLVRLAAIAVYAATAVALALLTTTLYVLAWPDPAPVLAGIGLGAALELLAATIPRAIHRPARTLPAIATGAER